MSSRIMSKIIFFLVLLISFRLQCQEVMVVPESFDVPEKTVSGRWHLGMGNYFDMPGDLQASGAGAKESASFWPVINGGRIYQGLISSHTLFQWNILMGVPRKVGDSDLMRALLSLDLMLGRSWDRWGQLSLGVAFFQQFLFFKDTGPTQTESGSGSSTFHRPDKVAWVSQQAMLLSYAHPLNTEHFLLEFKSYLFSLWNREKRTESYALNLNYRW